MKSKAILNKAMAIMTALVVAIQPATALAEEQTQNPTEATTKVKYEGVEHYSVVVPKVIQLKPDGTANFNVRAEGDLGEWQISDSEIFIPKLMFAIASGDEEGVTHLGCYLSQEGKEPIFAEFHEETADALVQDYMEQKDYKDIVGQPLPINFCNPLPDWARKLEAAEATPKYADDYNGITQEQFSNYYFGYDMGTSVPITVNLEGNKPVPAGDWEGEIMFGIAGSNFDATIPKDACDEAQKAYDEINANW